MTEFQEKILNELAEVKASIQKIEKVIDNITNMVNTLSKEDETISTTPATVPASEVKVGPELMRKPSDVIEEQIVKEKGEEKPIEGRTRCPQCGSLQFTELEDRSKVLYYQAGTPIYAKKKVCKKCSTEF
jgi:hypothetical protein